MEFNATQQVISAVMLSLNTLSCLKTVLRQFLRCLGHRLGFEG